MIMDYKEKYNKALDRAKYALTTDMDNSGHWAVNYIFPELKESDGEIRKALIDYFDDANKSDENPLQSYGIQTNKVIAWLEKQGEQSTDKIEPNPAWSEKDMSKVQRICKYLVEAKKYYADITEVRECIDWLKSLKERMQPQSKQCEHLENYDEEERVRKEIIDFITSSNKYGTNERCEAWLNWLEKQTESNPYSGVSFKHNGHIWGMCARDNGVEILFDGELKAFLSLEKSFIYPIYPKPDLAYKSALEAIKEEKVDNQNCVKSADKNENKKLWSIKQTLKISPKFCIGQVITDDNGTWYGIKNIKCLDDWYYELYDVGKANTHLELCSIIDEKFRENRFVGEIKKMMGD